MYGSIVEWGLGL